ncbi:MAG: FG-GAP-like repeat-containing protein [Planctomycetota bacterium]
MLPHVCTAIIMLGAVDGSHTDPQGHATASAVSVSPSDVKGQQLKEIDARLRASNAPFIGEADVDQLRASLARLPSNAPPMQHVALKNRLAEAYLAAGRIDEAIEQYESSIEVMRNVPNVVIDERFTAVMRRLAVAYLRLGERQNCVAHHNSESCIFPLSAAAVHVEPSGAQRAANLLGHILELYPSDLESAWLLNIVHMQLGDYPRAVPTAFRIPTSALASEHDVHRFVDIAPKLGLNSFKRAGGSLVEDLDNDGYMDVVISSMDTAQCLRYFHNNGDGTFSERTEQAGLSAQTGSLNFTHADYDNDGRQDLFAPRGA